MNAVNRRGDTPFLFFFPPFVTDGGVEIGRENLSPNLTFYAAFCSKLLVGRSSEVLGIVFPFFMWDVFT
jgi:hypothetical protein